MSEELQSGGNGMQGTPSAGTLLRTAREAQGLHIAALAVSLKVPVRKLEALEADRLEALPDAVFARALASSVCRALKIDAQPILQRLPQTQAPRLSTPQAGVAPFRGSSDSARPHFLSFFTRPAALAVIALLSAALLLLLMPDVSKQVSSVAASISLGNAVSSNEAPTASVPGTVVSSSVADTTKLAFTTPSLSMSPALSAPSTASPALGLATSAETALADGIVVFKATGESWVEVYDALGKLSLRRTLQAGESVGAVGTLPLRVTVGRADQTEILVRGKPFEGSVKVRDNVARFEVK